MTEAQQAATEAVRSAVATLRQVAGDQRALDVLTTLTREISRKRRGRPKGASNQSFDAALRWMVEAWIEDATYIDGPAPWDRGTRSRGGQTWPEFVDVASRDIVTRVASRPGFGTRNVASLKKRLRRIWDEIRKERLGADK